MILDTLLEFSDAQALTATADSTTVVDLSVDRDIGKGEAMALVINVVVAADVADADETYEFQLESDDNASMTSSTIVAGGTVAGADHRGHREPPARRANRAAPARPGISRPELCE